MSQEPMKTVGGRSKVLANDVDDDQAEVEQVAQELRAAVTDDQYAWPEYEAGTMAAAATNTAVMSKGGGELEWITMDGIQMNPKLAAELLLRKHGIKGVQLLTSDDLYASIGQIMNDRVAGKPDVGERVVLERLSQEFSG